MTFRNRTCFTIPLAASALVLLALPAVFAQIPDQLPDPDSKPPAANKPVKVYILSGQSNMVGIGQVGGGSVRWSGVSGATVSVYPGQWSPTANYDELTPIKTQELPVYGGVKPTPFPGGGTQVVSGEKGKYPEFAGNVLTVETRDFWKDASVSPRNQDFHYNGNAETYMMVGDALGRAMAELLEKNY